MSGTMSLGEESEGWNGISWVEPLSDSSKLRYVARRNRSHCLVVPSGGSTIVVGTSSTFPAEEPHPIGRSVARQHKECWPFLQPGTSVGARYRHPLLHLKSGSMAGWAGLTHLRDDRPTWLLPMFSCIHTDVAQEAGPEAALQARPLAFFAPIQHALQSNRSGCKHAGPSAACPPQSWRTAQRRERPRRWRLVKPDHHHALRIGAAMKGARYFVMSYLSPTPGFCF